MMSESEYKGYEITTHLLPHGVKACVQSEGGEHLESFEADSGNEATRKAKAWIDDRAEDNMYYCRMCGCELHPRRSGDRPGRRLCCQCACPRCDRAMPWDVDECTNCGWGQSDESNPHPCPKCGGDGQYARRWCDVCGGDGEAGAEAANRYLRQLEDTQ